MGGLSTSGSRDGQTAKDGSFRIVGCPPGSQSISAEAAGYAPANVVLALEPNLPPVTLTLRSGQTLRVRVFDTEGQPIPDARLWYDAFSSRVAGPNPQVTFLGRSDADGRIVWKHAPDQEMEFTCDEPNHISVDGLVLRPDGQEHLITLQQALVISGTVRDAQTGELVPRFTLGVGWPQRDRNGSLQPLWNDTAHFQPTFTGGEYRHTLNGPVVRGTTNHGYVFRFQAPGYAPFVSRVYGSGEGNITLNVDLQPVAQTLLTVYTPAGTSASWAQVAVLAPGDKVHLAGARFRAPQGSSWLIETDERGQFSLPGVDTIDRVVITHHEGFFECAAADLRLTQAVRLRPWAGIQGVWLETEGPVANCSVRLMSNLKQGFKWLVLERSTYQTFTDNNGNFSFSQVPPALLDVLTWQRPSNTNGISGASRMLTLETRSGITSNVSIGSTNQVLAQ